MIEESLDLNADSVALQEEDADGSNSEDKVKEHVNSDYWNDNLQPFKDNMNMFTCVKIL